MNRKRKKGAATMEMILMLPIWIILFLMIMVETAYNQTMVEASNELRMATRIGTRMNDFDDAIDTISEILKKSNHGESDDEEYLLTFEIYKPTSDDLSLVASSNSNWRNGNILRITTYKYTPFYRNGLTNVTLGKISYTSSKLKVETSIKMIINF